MAKITEGYMPYLGHETYYRIVGEKKDNGKAPHPSRATGCAMLTLHVVTTLFDL